MMSEQTTNPLVQSLAGASSVYRNWRERFAMPLMIGTLIIGPFALIPALISAQSVLLDAIFIGAYLSVALVTAFRFSYPIRIGVFLFVLYLLGVSELLSTGVLGDSLFFFLAFIVLATMLLSPLAGIIATGIDLFTYSAIGWLTLTGRVGFINAGALAANLQDWLSASALTVLFAVLIILGFRRLQAEFQDAQQQVAATVRELDNERSNLEKNVQARTEQLGKVNEIGRAASAILDPGQLYSYIVHSIGDAFNCYYTALFLLDPASRWAELKDATGEAGHVLKENKHRLDVNSRSLISIVIREGRTRIAQDTGESPAPFDNPLLPYTRSEIALPLIVGERVIGALDLQSTQDLAFSGQDIDTLQSMANQIAIALENARLFQQAEQSLAEMRAAQRQYLQGAWSSWASEKNLEYRLGDELPSEHGVEIDIPLALRDQIIGQISMAAESELTPEQRILVETIAAQTALALENARLFEESQSTAAHERLAADLTTKVWASSTVDGILQTTVRELGRALGASKATIELKMGSDHG